MENKKDIIGVPFPDCLYKIIDINDGHELGYNEDGEILISEPNVMLGYLDDKEENDNIFHIDENGVKWHHTGDIGFIDKKGLIYYPFET